MINLNLIFNSINKAETSGGYNCVKCPSLENVYVAKDYENYYHLFILNNNGSSRYSNDIVLSNIEYRHKRKCEIIIGNEVINNVFSYLRLTSLDYDLKNIYCLLLEGVLNDANAVLSSDWLINQFMSFAKLFEKLNNPPRNSVSGLFGELLFISECGVVSDAVRAWHHNKYANVDFTFKYNSYEVKTSESDNRIHHISRNQLQVVPLENLYIVSILVEETNSGVSVIDLMGFLNDILLDTELKDKLREQVIETIGRDFDLLNDIKFDLEKARNSMRFYNSDKLPKIESEFIPREITNVKYLLDLTSVNFEIRKNIKCR